MIIGRDLMVQLGLSDDFKCQVLQWDDDIVLMKEVSSLLRQTDLTSHEMREVVMQTAEPVSTREGTERMVKILDSTYARVDLDQVADNATHLNSEDITQLPDLLKDFEFLFDGTLGDWDMEPANPELNTDYKPFNCKYYPVPRINKEASHKYLERLV